MIKCKACKRDFNDYPSLLMHIDFQAEYHARRQLAGLKSTPALAQHVDLDFEQMAVLDGINMERRRRPRTKDDRDP